MRLDVSSCWAWTTQADGSTRLLKLFEGSPNADTAMLYKRATVHEIPHKPLFECRLAVRDFCQGDDDDALHVKFGLVGLVNTHGLSDPGNPIDFTESLLFHLTGAELRVTGECLDGLRETVGRTGSNRVSHGRFARYKIDCSDQSDVKFYIDNEDGRGYQRVFLATTFDASEFTRPLWPIVWMHRNPDETVADVGVDWMMAKSEPP